MQKIVPFFWCDADAKDAAQFYETVFPDTKIRTISTLSDTPSGTVENIVLDIMDSEIQLMSAGPLFKKNPSISLSVNVQTPEEARVLWEKLAAGGEVLMELDAYPWSQAYGWLNDKYGVSWQIMTYGERPVSQRLIPAIMFTQELAGYAEAAVNWYVSLFKNAHIEGIHRYTADQAPDKEGTVAHADFTLAGQRFMALDSAQKHAFKLNEAVSLMVYCDDQAEIDYFWDAFSKDGGEESQCGWVKDRFGVWWQVVPREMDAMMTTDDKEALTRVTQAFLQMKKFDLAALRAAYKGN